LSLKVVHWRMDLMLQIVAIKYLYNQSEIYHLRYFYKEEAAI
jgi:hypothetical protein